MTTTTPTADKRRVLIIDDSAEALKFERLLFEQAGAEVETFPDGATGSERAKEALKGGAPFDLIVVDIHMAEMTGFATARRIRMGGYQGPIVAFTAVASFKQKKEAQEAGINSYFNKTTLKLDLVQALLNEFCR